MGEASVINIRGSDLDNYKILYKLRAVGFSGNKSRYASACLRPVFVLAGYSFSEMLILKKRQAEPTK